MQGSRLKYQWQRAAARSPSIRWEICVRRSHSTEVSTLAVGKTCGNDHGIIIMFAYHRAKTQTSAPLIPTTYYDECSMDTRQVASMQLVATLNPCMFVQQLN